MRYQNSFLLLILFICCSSFKIDDNKLLGVWAYHGEKFAYAKQKNITKGPCIVFKEGGELIVRQNAGWCGTPPISYANFEGTWKVTSDTTLELKYKDWRGITTAEWKVTSLSNRLLKMHRVYEKPKN